MFVVECLLVFLRFVLYLICVCVLLFCVVCNFALFCLVYYLFCLSYLFCFVDEEIIDLVSPPTSPQHPATDTFVKLPDMPGDVSSPEGECFAHTTQVIRSRVAAAETHKIKNLDFVAAKNVKHVKPKKHAKTKQRKFKGHGRVVQEGL